jgi:hypothetical protein
MIKGPKLQHLISMMDFLCIDDFVIPDFNLRLPIETMTTNFRPDRIFKLHRRNGSMTYFGSGSAFNNDIVIRGIQINDTWIKRAYHFLTIEVDAKLNKKVKNECMPYLKRMLLKFNKIEFCEED